MHLHKIHSIHETEYKADVQSNQGVWEAVGFAFPVLFQTEHSEKSLLWEPSINTGWSYTLAGKASESSSGKMLAGHLVGATLPSSAWRRSPRTAPWGAHEDTCGHPAPAGKRGPRAGVSLTVSADAWWFGTWMLEGLTWWGWWAGDKVCSGRPHQRLLLSQDFWGMVSPRADGGNVPSRTCCPSVNVDAGREDQREDPVHSATQSPFQRTTL